MWALYARYKHGGSYVTNKDGSYLGVMNAVKDCS